MGLTNELDLIEAYNNLLLILTGTQDTAEISYVDSNGTIQTEIVPTLNSLYNKIQYLNRIFNKLIDGGQITIKIGNDIKVIKVTSPYSRFFKNPDIIKFTARRPVVMPNVDWKDTPTYPPVFIPIDIGLDIDAINVVKIIIDDIQTNNIGSVESFISELPDNISLDSMINILNNQGIKYTTVEQTISANVENISSVGTFVVLESNVINDKILSVLLNTVNYDGGNIMVGDIVIDDQGLEYKVISVSESTNVIELEYESIGIQPGTTLSKLKNQYENRSLFMMPINPFENFIYYWRPVAYQKAPTKYVYGGKYTTNLDVYDINGNVYDKSKIKDIRAFIFGKLNNKEVTEDKPKQIRPNPPTLYPQNFKVIKINTHLDNKIDKVKKLIQDKINIEKDIQNIDNQLKLNPNNKDLITKRLNLSKNLVSITNKILGENTDIPKPKFRLVGYFDVPEPIHVDGVGLVEPIRFVVRYKYLEKETNKQPNPEKVGVGYNPIWNEIKLKPREKYWDEERNEWRFKDEDITNPEQIPATNINIPINPGEKVELQVKALYELGYPNKPLESDWSNFIIVSFPDDLENVVITQKQVEKQYITGVIADVKDKINLHTIDEITTQSKSFAHTSDRILYDKQTEKSLKDVIDELYNKINVFVKRFSPPVIELIDDKGNKYTIQNMSQKTFVVGYYQDEKTQDGDIITKIWTLRLRPQKGLVLRLVSGYYGNLGIWLPTAITTDKDYNNLLRYDVSSQLGLSNIDIQTAITNNFYYDNPLLVGQSFSQFIYTRRKTLTEQNAVFIQSEISTITAVNDSELYGSTMGIDNVPIYHRQQPANGHQDALLVLPYDPEYDNTSWTRNIDVWTYTGNTSGGYLSEFCFHKDHPINGLNISAKSDFYNYVLPNTYGQQIYGLPAYSYQYEDIINITDKLYNVISRQWYWYPVDITPTTLHDRMFLSSIRTFTQQDKYLIGKYTCGLHIFLNPSINDIFVGPTKGSYKEIESESWIDIPIVIKYRLTDRLGYVGGYRHNTVLNNISYTAVLPIDIWYGNNDLFQFDLVFIAKYNRT